MCYSIFLRAQARLSQDKTLQPQNIEAQCFTNATQSIRGAHNQLDIFQLRMRNAAHVELPTTAISTEEFLNIKHARFHENHKTQSCSMWMLQVSQLLTCNAKKVFEAPRTARLRTPRIYNQAQGFLMNSIRHTLSLTPHNEYSNHN